MNFDEQQVVLAYGNTFESPNGKTVLDDLRKSYGQRSSFAVDPYRTAFHEGERAVLLRIEHLLAKAKQLTTESYDRGNGNDGNEYARTE